MEALALTLLGYPLSILASITYDQLKNISERIGDLTSIEKLYVKCFYKSIDQHNKHFDDFSRKILQEIKKAIKKDESKFLKLISTDKNIFITSFNRTEFQNDISNKIVDAYQLKVVNYPDLIPSIISDCFNYYISSFYDLMNEKQGIQAILVECLKLNHILDLLNKIDQDLATKEEFDNLRKTIYTYYIDNTEQYRKTLNDYDSYIHNKFKYLELRGFSPKVSGKEVQMELENIFVPLAITIQQRIVPNIQDKSNNRTKNSFESIEILNHRSLVILGDPGSGKSTLLKYLSTKITELRKSEHLLKNIVPIFFRLSDYSDFYKKDRKSIYEYITNYFDNQYQNIYKENFEYSNMLILMDGLDEIAETSLRLKVTEQVMDLIARYPNNRYIVTSRIVGYQESKLGGSFVHYKLLPFRKDQIKIFSDQWYKSIAANTDKNFEHAKIQSESLYKSIYRNPSVFKLASNPLLMTIISMIHYQGKKLPSKRVELYEISTETFLEHWVQLRITNDNQLKDKAEIVEILAPIAFEIHKTKSNALIEENEFKEKFLKYFINIHTNKTLHEAKYICNGFINFLRQQTGFFYEKGVDDEGNRFYGFMHLTFEEYLAAIEFVSRWSEKEILIEDYIFQPRWTEIIRLAASQIRLSFKGKAGRTQTSNFIEDILNVKDEFMDAYRPLQIACLIISDDVSISDELLNRIFDEIINILSTKNYFTLIKSFSKLFSELLQSDKQSYFISRLKESLTIKNETFLKNITIILADNYNYTSISDILKEISKNSVIRDQLLAASHINSIRNELFFKEIEKKYFYQYDFESINDDKKLLRSSIISFFELKKLTMYKVKYNDYDISILTNCLKTINNDNLKDIIVKTFIDQLLINNIKDLTLIDFIKKIKIEFSHPYFDNLLLSINKLGDNYIENFSYEKLCTYILTNECGYFMQNHKGIKKVHWNNDFTLLSIQKINIKKIETHLNLFKLNYSEDDYIKITGSLYLVMGPTYTKNDIHTFIEFYNHNILFDFFEWEDIPLANVANAPEELSNIIIKNASKYLDRKLSEKIVKEYHINIESINSMDIPSPVKLLLHRNISQPYDESLIKKSIDYYNNCSIDMKEGVFEILFSVLNISNAINNKLYDII